MSDWLLSKKKISLEKNKPELNRMHDAGLPGGIGRPVINSGKISISARKGPSPPPDKFHAGDIVVTHTEHTYDYYNNVLGKLRIKMIPYLKWDEQIHYWTLIIKDHNNNKTYLSNTYTNYVNDVVLDFSHNPVEENEIKYTDIIIEANIYLRYNEFTSIAQLNSNQMIHSLFVLSDQYKINKQLFYSNVLPAYNFPENGNKKTPYFAKKQPTGKNIHIGIVDDGIIDRHLDIHNIYNSIDWPYIAIQSQGGKLPYNSPFTYESITNIGSLKNINAGGYKLNFETERKALEATTWTNKDGAWFNSSTMTNLNDKNIMLFGGVDIGHYNYRNFENNHFNKNLWRFEYDSVTPENSKWLRYDNKILANKSILPDSVTEGTDSVFVNGKFHMFGGSHSLSHMILNKSLAFTNQFFEFNHNKNQWTQKDPSIEPSIDKEEKSRVPPDTRAYHKMVPLFENDISDAKQFVLFGGINLEEGDFYPSVEDNCTWIYDSSAGKDSWLRLPVHESDPDGRYLHNMAPIGDNRVVMIGGCTPNICEFSECHLNSENNLIDLSVTYNSSSDRKNFYINDDVNTNSSIGNIVTCGTNGTLLLSHYNSSSMSITKITLKNGVPGGLSKATHKIYQIKEPLLYFSNINPSTFIIDQANKDKILEMELEYDVETNSKILFVKQTNEVVKFPGDENDPSANIFNLFAVSGEEIIDLSAIDFKDNVAQDKDDGVLEYVGGDTVGYYWHDISGFSSDTPQKSFTYNESHLNSVAMWPTYPDENTNNSVAKLYVGGDDDYLHMVDVSTISAILVPENKTVHGVAKDISPFRRPCYLVNLLEKKSFTRFENKVTRNGVEVGYVKYDTNNSDKVYIEVFDNTIVIQKDDVLVINNFQVIVDVFEFQPGGQFQQGSYIASNFNLVSDYKYGGDDKTSKQNNKYGGKKNYIGNVLTFKRFYGTTSVDEGKIRCSPVEGNGKYVFCTGAGKSLYRSSDYGESWEQLLHWGIDGAWGNALQDPKGVGGKYRNAEQFIRSIDVFGTKDISGISEATRDKLNPLINYYNNGVWVVGTYGLLGYGENFGDGPWHWMNPQALDFGTIYFTKRNNAWKGDPIYNDATTSELYKTSQVPVFNTTNASDSEKNSLAFDPQQVISMDNVIIRIRDFKNILDENGMIKTNVSDSSWNIMPSKDGIALGFCNAGGGAPEAGNKISNNYQPWIESTDFFVAHWSPKKDSSFINHYFYFTNTDDGHINDHQEIQKRTFPNDALGGDLMAMDDNGVPFDVFNSDHAGEIWSVGGNWIPKEPEAFAMMLTSKEIVRDEGNFADEDGAQTWIFQYDKVHPEYSYWMNVSIPVVKQKLILQSENTLLSSGKLLYQPDTGARGYIISINTTTVIVEMIKGYIQLDAEKPEVYQLNYDKTDGWQTGDISLNIGTITTSEYPYESPDTTQIVENPKGVAPYASYFDNATFTYYNNGRTLDTSSNYTNIKGGGTDISYNKAYKQSRQALLQDLSGFSCKTNFCNGDMSYIENNVAMMYGGIKGIFPERESQRVEIINDRYFLFNNTHPVKTLSGEDLIIEDINDLKNQWPVYSINDFDADNAPKQLDPSSYLNSPLLTKDISNEIPLPSEAILYPTWYIYRSGTFETFIFNYDATNYGRDSTWTTLLDTNNKINRGPRDASTNQLYDLTSSDNSNFPPVDHDTNSNYPAYGAYQDSGYRYGHKLAHLTEKKALLWGGLSYDMSKERNGFIIEPGFHEGGVYPEPFKYIAPENSYKLQIKNPRTYYDYLVDNFGEKHGVYLTDQRLGWTTDTYVFHYKGGDGGGDVKDSYWENLHIDRPGYSVEPVDNYYPGNAASHGTSVGSIINSNKKSGYHITQPTKFLDTTDTNTLISSDGIQGIAFDSKLYVFRAWDNEGNWPRPITGIDWREIMYNENTSYFTHNLVNNNVKICNNSWGFLTFSTGFKYRGWFIDQMVSGDKAEYNKIYKNYIIQSQLGIVNVCAAGNNSDSESNLLAGTPLYVPECKKHWINVVGLEVTDDGIVRETYYTNRAGLCWPWTISAIAGSSTTDGGVLVASNQKGMEDHEDTKQIPGYKKVQGTSMATPLVSGALAMIMERFPNLTSAQCVDRLFQTAAGGIGTAVNGIGTDISGRISTAFANPNEIFKRYYKGHLCDPPKDNSSNSLILKANPNSTADLYNQTDISAVFGWGFLDVSAACAPMDENDYQKLLDFGIEREKLINQVIKETFGVTTGIKDISGLSDEMEGSIRLIYPSPEMAPPDGLGRRRRRRRRNGLRRRPRGRRGRARRRPRRAPRRVRRVRRKRRKMGRRRVGNRRKGRVRGVRNRRRARVRKRKVRRGRRYSDRLLKDNVKLIGYSNTNIPVYEFTYKYNVDPTKVYTGTIAQDVLDMGLYHVVHRENTGYYSVNYDLIDVPFCAV